MRQTGFTVIEVMLFLAVSAALSAAIFLTSMLNINQQRYMDAVRSFKALTQEQYINTTRVQNPNNTDSQCPGAIPAQARGTNDCLVVGKLVSVNNNGASIVIRNIVGVPPIQETYSSGDIAAIQAMTSLYVVNAGTETLSPEWDTALAAKLGAAPSTTTFSLAIVRSPATGTPYTFFIPGKDFVPLDSTSVGEDIRADVIGVPPIPPPNLLTNDLIICIEPRGLTADSWRQEIVIHGKISGPSGVEQRESAGCL